MRTTILPARANRAAGGKNRRAFTLVELLVVIGIIALLVGILIPVVASVRKAAYQINTRNEINTIVGAIDSYYGDFKAYPGPIAEANLIDSTNTLGSTGAICTSSQNLVWGLEGGWEPLFNRTTNGAFQSAKVGVGAMSFNGASTATLGQVSASETTRYRTYIDATYLLPMPWTGNPYGVPGSPQDTTTGQYAPVYVDRYPTKLALPSPILYMRAHQGVVGTQQNPLICTSDSGGSSAAYDNAELSPYASVYLELAPGHAPPTPAGKALPDYTTWTAYFQDPNTVGVSNVQPLARHADTYLLISPGYDGQFGTADDISN